MDFQLAAIILLVILYPVGFWLANRKGTHLIGLPVLLLFLASAIYLLVSSWLLFLMMLGSGVLILMGTALFDIASNARAGSEIYPYLKGRARQALFFGLILVGGGIYVFILSIIKCLG